MLRLANKITPLCRQITSKNPYKALYYFSSSKEKETLSEIKKMLKQNESISTKNPTTTIWNNFELNQSV